MLFTNGAIIQASPVNGSILHRDQVLGHHTDIYTMVFRGEEVVTEMTTADPCPECCGGLEAQGDPKNPRYLRCTSCGLIFRPLKEEG